MKSRLCVLVVGAIFLVACRAAHDVAVTSYHAATAPVRFVHHQIERPPETSANSSDVTVPGQPVLPTPTPSKRNPTVTERSTTGSSVQPKSTPDIASKMTPPRIDSTHFPVGKPVPNKPGYVYSPSDPGKYVDVSGYASGSKVKDPYSGKIFLVP